jgi:hypothetical protein
VLEVTYQLGLVLGFAVWVRFGAVLLPVAFDSLRWQVVVYAVVGPAVVRMVPVAIASRGAPAPTVR